MHLSWHIVGMSSPRQEIRPLLNGHDAYSPPQNPLDGRAGRNAIEHEDLTRDSIRWQRRKKAIEKFTEFCHIEREQTPHN